MLGIDAVPALIEEARQRGLARYLELSYSDLTRFDLKERFDCVVCNFSLIGDTSVRNVFRCIPQLFNEDGIFTIQTLHPHSISNTAYEDGWKEGSWNGFSNKFSIPAPWYFKTLESWKELFREFKIDLIKTIEVKTPKVKTKVSILFISELS